MPSVQRLDWHFNRNAILNHKADKPPKLSKIQSSAPGKRRVRMPLLAAQVKPGILIGARFRFIVTPKDDKPVIIPDVHKLVPSTQQNILDWFLWLWYFGRHRA